MTDTEQSPNTEAEPGQEPTSPSEGQGPSRDQSPEHSGETPEIQARPHIQLHAERVRAVEELMVEKERLQLGYIYGKVQRPFYARWKAEANALFVLRVMLKRRKLA